MIDPIRVHLAINHFPIISLFIAVTVLLYGILSDKRMIIQTGLAIVFFSGMVGIAVHFSGEEAEHALKSLAGTSEHFLEEHEELADAAFTSGLILSILSLGLFLIIQFTDRKIRTSLWLLVLCSLMVFGLYFTTAAHGGKSRHVAL